MKRFLLTLGLAIGSCSWVHADLVRGSQMVAIYGGVGGSSTPYDFEPGRRRSVTGGGGALGGQYVYTLTNHPCLAVGADVASSLNGDARSERMLLGYDTTARLKALTGLVIARLSFPRGTVRPYLFAGLGAHHSTQELSAQPLLGQTWPDGGTESRILIDEHRTSAAIGYGIGLDIFPKEAFFIGVEARGTWLAGLHTKDTAALRAAGFTADEDREQDIELGNIFLRFGVKF